MDIPEIKQQLSISLVLTHYGLTPDKHHKLNCPFHKDKTPSLQVYPKTNSWHCFGCGAGSDQLDFIRQMEKLPDSKSGRYEAIQIAKSLVGPVAGAEPSTNKTNSLSRRALLAKTFEYFKKGLNSSKPVKEYLQSRKLDITKLEIGYNNGLFHRKEDRLFIEAAVQYGLLKPYKQAGSYLVFGKGYLSFPLKDKEGHITSLYFRAIDENSSTKHLYLNDREGLYPGYPSKDTETLILTESVIDCASLLQHRETINIPHVAFLALYGTNGFTAEHDQAVKQLESLKEIILFLDGDEPGKLAIEKYTKKLSHEYENVLINSVDTPGNEDINSLIQSHEPAILGYLVAARKLFHTPVQPMPAERLDVSNPDHIVFEAGTTRFSLLGGLAMEQLDRMRVTLKTQKNGQSLRHSIDLYNDDQVTRYVRKVTEKLNLSTKEIDTGVSSLVDHLEQYRLSYIEKRKSKQQKPREVTKEQKEAAITYLKAADLLERTNLDIGRSGVIGEETNRLLMYLVFTSRLRQEPLHIISLGASGTGKTYLQEKVSALIPEQDKLEITILSDNAFYYFKQKELKNKLVLIEDLDGAQNVLYPLRELMSKKRIVKTVPLKDKRGNLETISLEVEGPISLAGTTTKERIYEDNANRSFLVYLDESKTQKEAIMDYQRTLSAGKIDVKEEDAARELLKDVQSVLKPVKVINPYAEKLKLPAYVFKPLRTNAHYLALIETITFYHQYQRKEKKEPGVGCTYIETTIADIEAANKLVKDVLLAKSDELSGACRRFFERLKAYLLKEKQESFYAGEMRKAFRMNPSNLKYYLTQLQRYGYLKIVGGNRYKRGYEYEVASYKDYKQLTEGISHALDEALAKIKRLSG